MRTPKTFCWLFTLGFVLVPSFGVNLDAQDNATCTTTTHKMTYFDAQGKVQLQTIEIRSGTPGLVVAQYSLTSRKPIKLTNFWKLRRKGYLACAEYYEKIEKLQAEKKGSGPTSVMVRSAFR